jgi:hypothetical protein
MESKYPVAGPFTSRGESRSADQEGTLSGQDRLNSKVCRFFLQESEHVVHVELRVPAIVRRVGRQGVAVKGSNCYILQNSELHRYCGI